MQKSVRIQAIFAELREAGVEASARDLLRIANYILLTFAADSEDDAEGNQGGGGMDARRFFALPIDEAMNDGGWRILEFEARREAGDDDRSAEKRVVFEHCIRRVLGPAWQHQQQLD